GAYVPRGGPHLDPCLPLCRPFRDAPVRRHVRDRGSPRRVWRERLGNIRERDAGLIVAAPSRRL
ncbi:hypothetical protein NGM37_54365, partial [Streptomyces sp. TRM76130]|nr:hypothetical protein [Streptomyces sp. TRM76130]